MSVAGRFSVGNLFWGTKTGNVQSRLAHQLSLALVRGAGAQDI